MPDSNAGPGPTIEAGQDVNVGRDVVGRDSVQNSQSITVRPDSSARLVAVVGLILVAILALLAGLALIWRGGLGIPANAPTLPAPTLPAPTLPVPTLAVPAPTLAPPTATAAPPCPYAGRTDDDTIRQLIQAEAEAVNGQSLDVITAIFAPDAVITDYAGQRSWPSPLARYQDYLFREFQFRAVEHFDIVAVGQDTAGAAVWYTSGSRGYYQEGQGSWQTFFNGSLISQPRTDYGSDHWTFGRTSAGCWMITRFDLNAGHIAFPP